MRRNPEQKFYKRKGEKTMNKLSTGTKILGGIGLAGILGAIGYAIFGGKKEPEVTDENEVTEYEGEFEESVSDEN
jgi:hypothetical protein